MGLHNRYNAIATVEIRGAGFPYLYLRMYGFYGFPDGLAETLALNTLLHIAAFPL